MAKLASNATTDINLWQYDNDCDRDRYLSIDTIRSSVTTENQFSIALVGGIPSSFAIPFSTRLFTICTNGNDLVYYTTNGSLPTTNNAWFFSLGKETWDNNIPMGATMTFLSPSDSQIAIVVRY